MNSLYKWSRGRTCTCHPAEAPIPCAEQYALSECLAVAAKRVPPQHDHHVHRYAFYCFYMATIGWPPFGWETTA